MTRLSNLTALAVGIAVIAPAQAQTVVSTKVTITAEVTVLSSGTPVVTVSTNSNTVTKTLADGSVVSERTPLTATVTATPQTIRTDLYTITTTKLSNGATKVDKKLVSSVVGTRTATSQSVAKGTVLVTVISGPKVVVAPTPGVTGQPVLDYNPKTYSATAYYNNTNLGRPTSVPSNDPAFYITAESNNKVISTVNANYAYARGWTGLGSTVLIMDTGVNAAHPDLAGKVKYTMDFTGAGIKDTNGHGTHLAGIVAANRNGVGMHGVAYDANLAIAKVATGANVNMSAVNSAMAWASQYSDVVVANLSANVNYSADYKAAMKQVAPGLFVNNHQHYGGVNYYNLETPQAWNIPKNMVMTVSAGNDANGYVQSPAVFATAVDASGKLALGGRMLVVGNWNAGLGVVEGAKAGTVCKNYQANVCRDPYKMSDFYILAPGSGVTSTGINNDYKVMSGTSQAAPVVAGAVAIVNQLWPYMTPENQVQLLLKTANKKLPKYDVNVMGQGLLDLDAATRPVGTLGISVTGRTGATVPIAGTLSVAKASTPLKTSSITAVDSFQRDFRVDVGSLMNNDKRSDQFELFSGVDQPWSARLAGIPTISNGNIIAGSNGTNSVMGWKSEENNGWTHQAVLGIQQANPWVQFNGMWGTMNSSTNLEYTTKYQQGAWYAKGGVISNNSNYTSGLVANVGAIYSAYGSVGLQSGNVTVESGIKPAVVSGAVTLRMPGSVDASGEMAYDVSKVNLRDTVRGYVAASWTSTIDKTGFLSLSAQVDNQRQLGAAVRFNKVF
jgi:subtilisin family serine protease